MEVLKIEEADRREFEDENDVEDSMGYEGVMRRDGFGV